MAGGGVNWHGGGALAMAIGPFESIRLGHTGVRVSRLGFGCAPIGGLFRAVTDEAADEVATHAWDIGIRYFDVAPLYGYGSAERRIGRMLAGRPRQSFALSTKVGRVIYPRDAVPAGAEIDRQALDGREDAFYIDPPPVRPVFDYSRDGVMRSVEASLDRLGLDRVDILFIHDPDDHWEAAIGEAYPALAQLRAEGTVGAIGVGINQVAMLAQFAREGDFDVFLAAGRYTLLDQTALPELLPLCIEKDIAVVLGGVMNSGLLADPRPGATFDYVPADPRMIERAERIRAVCERHEVPLRAAAVQFPLAHPAVVSLVAGVRRIEHLDEYPELMRRPIPADLWSELKAEGLLAENAPTPSAPEPRPT
jgi:D-threo-aldose 1-dehydrogenase